MVESAAWPAGASAHVGPQPRCTPGPTTRQASHRTLATQGEGDGREAEDAPATASLSKADVSRVQPAIVIDALGTLVGC